MSCFAEMFPDFHDRLVDDTAPFDKWGIECGDGWFALVDRLSHACENEIKFLRIQGVAVESWPRIGQIKETMGSLRFYVNGQLSNELRAQILNNEKEGLRICEFCGVSGKSIFQFRYEPEGAGFQAASANGLIWLKGEV